MRKSEGKPNALRWACEERGCWVVNRHLPLERFYSLFPGKTGMTDIDGLVQVDGGFLILEAKTGRTITTGQDIALQEFTRQRCPKTGKQLNIAIYIELGGLAKDFDIRGIRYYFAGALKTDWRDAAFDDVRELIAAWVSWIKRGAPLLEER